MMVKIIFREAGTEREVAAQTKFTPLLIGNYYNTKPKKFLHTAG
jgi:hypothetical protein